MVDFSQIFETYKNWSSQTSTHNPQKLAVLKPWQIFSNKSQFTIVNSKLHSKWQIFNNVYETLDSI